jgi:MFS family permease
METPKSKGVGQILWEAVELWKDHLFPLVWVSLVLTAILVFSYWAIYQWIPMEYPEQVTGQALLQAFAGVFLGAIVLIAFTAILDVVIWFYFSGMKLEEMLRQQRKKIELSFYRLFAIDFVFIAGSILGISGFFMLISYLAQQDQTGLVFFLSVFFIVLLIALFLGIFVPYRFILRPKMILEALPFKQAWKESYQLYLTYSLKTIGLVILTYVIVFVLTPRSGIAWINQIPLVILGPYVSIVIWIFYSNMILLSKEKISEKISTL